MNNKNNTSWEQSAEWYDHLLEGEGTYQKDLILPNLLRLMDIKRDERVLDLACGQGFFSRAFASRGARVTGIDASKSLIRLAKNHAKTSGADIEFRVAAADELSFLKNESIDAAAIILALQNMEQVAQVLRECARVLAPHGVLHMVLNHPAFRVPQESSWGWDAEADVQYRRINRYLSESKVKIKMHPGDEPEDYTWSFHRPLQFYIKTLAKAGFAVTALEEWNSHKKSEPGPRAAAEDRARKEIPLFLYLSARKLSVGKVR